MTPNDLYARVAESVERNPDALSGCYYNHLAPFCDEYYGRYEDSDRLEIKILKYFDFDGRRIWRLATVWLDQKPLMIIQNAGREGDDHVKRYITDLAAFGELCRHVLSLRKFPDQSKEVEDVVAPDEEMGANLVRFYGNELDGCFERYR